MEDWCSEQLGLIWVQCWHWCCLCHGGSDGISIVCGHWGHRSMLLCSKQVCNECAEVFIIAFNLTSNCGKVNWQSFAMVVKWWCVAEHWALYMFWHIAWCTKGSRCQMSSTRVVSFPKLWWLKVIGSRQKHLAGVCSRDWGTHGQGGHHDGLWNHWHFYRNSHRHKTRQSYVLIDVGWSGIGQYTQMALGHVVRYFYSIGLLFKLKPYFSSNECSEFSYFMHNWYFLENSSYCMLKGLTIQMGPLNGFSICLFDGFTAQE